MPQPLGRGGSEAWRGAGFRRRRSLAHREARAEGAASPHAQGPARPRCSSWAWWPSTTTRSSPTSSSTSSPPSPAACPGSTVATGGTRTSALSTEAPRTATGPCPSTSPAPSAPARSTGGQATSGPVAVWEGPRAAGDRRRQEWAGVPGGAQRAPGRLSPGAGVRWTLGSNPSSSLTRCVTLHNALGFWCFLFEVGTVIAFGGSLRGLREGRCQLCHQPIAESNSVNASR